MRKCRGEQCCEFYDNLSPFYLGIYFLWQPPSRVCISKNSCRPNSVSTLVYFQAKCQLSSKIFQKRMSGLSSEPWGPLCPKFWTSNRIVLRLHLLKWPNMKEFCILTLFSPGICLLWILTFNKNKTIKFRDVRASKTSYSMSQSKATTNPRIWKDEQILMKIYV